MVRAYKVPEPSSSMWRYMDFTKFVSILSTRSLYFSNAACFDDEFEGAKGLRKNKQVWDSHYLDFFRRAVRSVPVEVRLPLAEEEIEREAKRLLRDMEVAGELDKRRNFISCWHENEHESEAMWKLYSTFIEHAIAIRTTYARLYEALGQNPDIQIGRIEYVDLENDFVDVNDTFWRKRKSFEHENEVRALIFDPEHKGAGIAVPCDVKTLIESVVISPRAPGWFATLVADVTQRFGYELPINQSFLSQEPFY